jgi:hypothetical protein
LAPLSTLARLTARVQDILYLPGLLVGAAGFPSPQDQETTVTPALLDVRPDHARSPGGSGALVVNFKARRKSLLVMRGPKSASADFDQLAYDGYWRWIFERNLNCAKLRRSFFASSIVPGLKFHLGYPATGSRSATLP